MTQNLNTMLTKEGEKMYRSLSRNKRTSTPHVPPINIDTKPLSELQVDFFRTELANLIENSRRVTIDCDKILSLCETRDEYLKNDAKVAKMIHSRLIDRYTRMLNYQSPL